jgi:fermentation-respiration switch protein FrsA (DUF1100 family)
MGVTVWRMGSLRLLRRTALTCPPRFCSCMGMPGILYGKSRDPVMIHDYWSLGSRLTYCDAIRVTGYQSLESSRKKWAPTSLFSPIAGEASCWQSVCLVRCSNESLSSYGLSTGRPCEKGLNIDAQTALDYLLENPATKNTKIIVYGQSLGGALSIQLVSRNQSKVHGLVLENTFRSIRTLIPTVFPPARYLARLCHQIWPSETTLPLIKDIPVLFLSGLKDELVPYVSLS